MSGQIGEGALTKTDDGQDREATLYNGIAYTRIFRPEAADVEGIAHLVSVLLGEPFGSDPKGPVVCGPRN